MPDDPPAPPPSPWSLPTGDEDVGSVPPTSGPVTPPVEPPSSSASAAGAGPFHEDWQEHKAHRNPGPLGYAVPTRGYVPSYLDTGARNAMIWGFVSFTGVVCCLGILAGGHAILEGVRARERIRRSDGTLNGEGMAVAAIVLGAMGIVVSVAAMVWAAFYGPGATARGGGSR